MVGIGGGMSQNEIELYEYGIQNEKSDIRAHVCPLAKRVYIFPTEEGIKAIKTGKFPTRLAYQKGIDKPTGKGYLVPPFSIERCIGIEINPRAWKHYNLDKEKGLSEKGKGAEDLIKDMIILGLFPLPGLPKSISEKDIQIQGDRYNCVHSI